MSALAAEPEALPSLSLPVMHLHPVRCFVNCGQSHDRLIKRGCVALCGFVWQGEAYPDEAVPQCALCAMLHITDHDDKYCPNHPMPIHPWFL